jgi:hypothetical protein
VFKNNKKRNDNVEADSFDEALPKPVRTLAKVGTEEEKPVQYSEPIGESNPNNKPKPIAGSVPASSHKKVPLKKKKRPVVTNNKQLKYDPDSIRFIKSPPES